MREPATDLLLRAIRLLREQPRTRNQLPKLLHCSQSAADQVLGWLSAKHPTQLRKERQPAHASERILYRWDDVDPVAWDPPRLLLPDAARGLAWAAVLLRQIAGGSQAAAALDALILQARVPTTGADMPRAAPAATMALLIDAWARACVAGRACSIIYRRPGKDPVVRVVQPLRWFIGRDGVYGLARQKPNLVVTYKLSRLSSLAAATAAPAWMSTPMSSDAIERRLAQQVSAFVGEEGQRKTVILAMDLPTADRFMEYGLPDLRWDDAILKPTGARLSALPADWRRCSCTVAGWYGLLPLIMSNGTGLRVEHPPELVDQVMEEARTVLRNHRKR